MAHLEKPTMVRYVDAGGKRVKKGTPGAQKVKSKARCWYGVWTDVNGVRHRRKLSANRTAANQMLAELVRKTELARAGIIDPFETHRRRPLREHLADWEAA